MTDRSDEVHAAVDRYLEIRRRMDADEGSWDELAEMFTDDAIYVDPAWGRVEGIEAIRTFLVESMAGLDDWRFPVDFVAVDGDRVVVKWRQVLPGTDAEGRTRQQSGVSTMLYGGDGRFGYEEDLLNMAHVMEDLRAVGWTPPEGFNMPPAQPDRDFSAPGT